MHLASPTEPVDPFQQGTPLPRLITTASGVIAGLVVLLPPLIFGYLGWDHVEKQIHSELRIHTIFINKFISQNPEIWSAQGIRLRGILEDIHAPHTSVHVLHLGKQGELMMASELVEPLPWPHWTLQEDLFDYGELVGKIEITRSIRELWLGFIIIIITSSILGFAIFFPVRTLSIRIVRQAMTALEQARQAAEEANTAKSRFLANMSHELRTPLNAVIGLTDLALQTELHPNTRDYLCKVVDASHSLLRLINDILDLSKMDAGKLEMESIPFALGEVMERLSTLFTGQIGEKSVVLNLPRTPEWSCVLVGDPLRLEQVLSNLLSNAIKFTQTGAIGVGVRILEENPTVSLEFQVQDTGMGMTEEQIAKLFQPFVQADGSMTRRFGGTGLGLAICQRLVERMGGTIWVTSTPEIGSCFFFTIRMPRRHDLEQQPSSTIPARQKSVAITPTEVRGKIGGARVLLVEDNAINRQVACEVLRGVGLIVDVAEDGLQGVRKVLESPFDLVLMDLQMPVMDGLEAARRIRAHPVRNDVPIVAMTAHAMLEERERCLAVGMNDHVAKPIDKRELYRALLHWIAWRNPAESAGASLSIPADSGLVTEEMVAIPGIDALAALERMDGNHELLHHLMIRFRRDYLDAMPHLKTLLTTAQWKAAGEWVHTIKGVAGNIGAEGVFMTARELEKLLRTKDHTHLPEVLERFDLELQQVLRGIGAWSAATVMVSNADAVSMKPEQMLGQVRELAELIQNQDFIALKGWERLRPVLDPILPTKSIEAVSSALDRFDFVTARTALMDLESALRSDS
ncbi:MAG: response regulator [Magnetococcales bacterium]|nr:response regulator [Magnetococcales bacterium]NGZ06733.1 response regulator [Magnetococcales bacterium]